MKLRHLLPCLSLLFLTVSVANRAKSETNLTFTGFDRQAHRGGRALMPENTIPAMLHAVDLGVTTLELDVVISKDNQVVVSHDVFINHLIALDPEGREFSREAEGKFILRQMDYAEVKRFDVGSKVHPDFPRQRKMPVVKPLLAELIAAVEAHVRAKGSAPMRYNIETKTSEKDPAREAPPPQFVDLLMQAIKAAGVEARVTIQSFDVRTLQVLHRDHPQMNTSLLISASNGQTLAANLARLGFTPSVYSPEQRLVDAAMVRACHQLGMQVIPWTVNSGAEMQPLVDLGVDGIISDSPDLFPSLKLPVGRQRP